MRQTRIMLFAQTPLMVLNFFTIWQTNHWAAIAVACMFLSIGITFLWESNKDDR